MLRRVTQSAPAIVTVVSLATVVAALLLLLAPAVVLVPFVAVAAWGLTWPMGRLLWLVVGGMVSLQSTEGLSPQKLVYIGGVVIAVTVAVHRLPQHMKQPWAQVLRLPIRGTWLIAAVVVFAAVVGVTNGMSFVAVGRDGLTYALLLAGVPLAVDAAASLSTRTADRLVVGIALLASVGFAIAWTSKRGVGQLDIEQLILPSNFLMALGVAHAAARGLIGPRIRWGWLAVVPVIIAGQLVTGTRTGLVLVIAILGIIGARRAGRASASRVLFGLSAAVLALVALLPFLSSKLTSEAFFERRLADAQAALTGGWQADQSGSIRLVAQSIAENVWSSHRLAGTGFGYIYANASDWRLPGSFQLDSSVIILGKFGLVGALVLAVGLALLFSPMRTAGRILGEKIPEQAIIRGSVVYAIAILPFGPPTEDKGFAMGIALLLLLIGTSLRERMSDRGEEADSSATAVPTRPRAAPVP